MVAYALAGTLRIDITKEPIAVNDKGKNIYFKDLWPNSREIEDLMTISVSSDQFKEKYAEVFKGTAEWAELSGTGSSLFSWTEDSSYIRRPPFFDTFKENQKFADILGAKTLAILPDATTTDHISPAGVIPFDEPAGKYLVAQAQVFPHLTSTLSAAAGGTMRS